MLGYLSLDIIYSSKHTVYLKLHFRKTDTALGNISRIFSREMEVVVYTIANQNVCYIGYKQETNELKT